MSRPHHIEAREETRRDYLAMAAEEARPAAESVALARQHLRRAGRHSPALDAVQRTIDAICEDIVRERRP